ncbi:MAG: hypothetical protein KKD77_20970, partial [Gammaproteobacteria bacterium]|nr:hypothetical protein [Gammaproteobacteria bacterium]
MATILEQLGSKGVEGKTPSGGTILDQLGGTKPQEGFWDADLTDVPGLLWEGYTGGADAAARFGLGALGWITGKAGGLADIGLGKLSGMDPKLIREMAEATEQQAGEFFTPSWKQPEVSEKILDPVMKGIELLVTPAKWVDQALVEKHPNLGYTLSFLTEMALFKGAHAGKNYAVSKLRRIKSRLDSGKPDEAVKAAMEIPEELGVTPEELRTPEGRQTAINRQTAPELRTPEQKQAFLEEEFVRPSESFGLELKPTIEDIPSKSPEARAMESFIQRQKEFTAGELASARPIGDILAEIES